MFRKIGTASIIVLGLALSSTPAAAQQMSNICLTNAGTCRMFEVGPVGYSCFCAMPYVGNIPGRVISADVARVCVTGAGTCPMAMAIPVGSDCFCPTAFGLIPGLAR